MSMKNKPQTISECLNLIIGAAESLPDSDAIERVKKYANSALNMVKDQRRLSGNQNTQLPKEVVEEITLNAEGFANSHVNGRSHPELWDAVFKANEAGATAYASKLHQANETIKVLAYDNNRLKGEVEGLTSALDELRTKYDNILATESGHESKTENVWQSGYAAGHEAGCERGKREAQPGAVWVKGAPKERKQHFAKVPSALDEDIFYEAVIWPISDSDHWWCVGEGFKFTTHKDKIIAHIDESAAGREDAVSKEVLEFIRDIAYNWDCDEDSHKYNTVCRKCSASELYYDLTKQQKNK